MNPGRAAVVWIAASWLLAGCAPDARPRNAILIVLDTLRADRVSVYGNPRETTPALDALAERGVVFETAVTNAPWTLAAMGALLAGEYPTARVLDEGLQMSLVEALRDAGWRTAAFTEGGFVSEHFGFERGFDEFREVQGKSHRFTPVDPTQQKAAIDTTFAGAREWLENVGEEPFFLLVHSYEPHMPYRRQTYAAGIERGSLDETFEIVHLAMSLEGMLPLGERELAYIRALYDGGVTTSDHYVGELLATLDRLGLVDDTLVVVTSDHGEDLGDRMPLHPGSHGHSLYDEQLLVPLILFDPTRDYPVSSVATQIRTIDVMPTILELLGVPRIARGHGRSLLPLMRGEETGDRPAWIEVPASTKLQFERHLGLRTGREKLVVKPATEAKDEAWVGVFDLEADPVEANNLGASDAARRRALTTQLRELQAELRADGPARYGGVRQETEEVREQLRALGYIE